MITGIQTCLKKGKYGNCSNVDRIMRSFRVISAVLSQCSETYIDGVGHIGESLRKWSIIITTVCVVRSTQPCYFHLEDFTTLFSFARKCHQPSFWIGNCASILAGDRAETGTQEKCFFSGKNTRLKFPKKMEASYQIHCDETFESRCQGDARVQIGHCSKFMNGKFHSLCNCDAFQILDVLSVQDELQACRNEDALLKTQNSKHKSHAIFSTRSPHRISEHMICIAANFPRMDSQKVDDNRNLPRFWPDFMDLKALVFRVLELNV